MKGQLSKTTTESCEKTDNQDIFKIDQVLENEDLVRKEVSEEQDSLFRAFSDGLYFTPNYYQQIKDQLIRYLSKLITTNTIPSKLGIFRGNSVLWNDYSKNPSCSDFLRINIELFSLVFSVRVLVYTVTADGSLTAQVFNNKFDKSIQFINTDGVHLDVIHAKKSMQIIGACQDLVLNLVDMVSEGKQDFKDYEWKDFNNDQYISSWLSCAKSSNGKTKESQNEEETVSTQHKRGKSDSDLQVPSQDQLHHFNMFVDSKPSEEISKIIQKDVPSVSQSPNLSLTNESSQSTTETKNSSARKANLDLKQRNSFPNQRRAVLSDEDEELPPPDQTKLEKSKSYMDSALQFTGAMPPGITPNRYSTKTYGADSFTQAASEVQPKRHRFSESHSHALLHDSGFHQQFATRVPPKNLNLSPNTEDKSQGNVGNSTQGNEASHQISRAANPRSSEKKRSIVPEESLHRFTGKLKFFDEGKSYGFIVMDDDGSDIFVHFDDLHKANLSKDTLKAARFGNAIKLSFNCMEYVGKYNKSRKATDIQLLA